MRRPPTAVSAASLLLCLTLSPIAASAAPAAPVDAADAATQRSAEPQRVAGARLDAVLARVNKARKTPRRCGDTRYRAVPRLRGNVRLDRSAGDFARLMARRDFFDHESPNGDGPGERISDAGYRWTSYGENIAAGYRTPADVVRGWLQSPGHCSAIMGRFRHVGVGYAYDADSTYGSYWVLDFGTR